MAMCATLRDYVDGVCRYLGTEEGGRELRKVMNTPYKGGVIGYVGAVAQVVVVQCREMSTEDLTAVTDEIVIRMLGIEEVA